jgi:hypothetical protein
VQEGKENKFNISLFCFVQHSHSSDRYLIYLSAPFARIHPSGPRISGRGGRRRRKCSFARLLIRGQIAVADFQGWNGSRTLVELVCTLTSEQTLVFRSRTCGLLRNHTSVGPSS